jgi:uncharacterized protein
MQSLAKVQEVDASFPGFFRYRVVAGRYLVTNQAGQWLFLEPAEFEAFMAGRPAPGEPLYEKLKAANLVRADIDIDDLGRRLAERKRFLAYGPNLHICVVTLRCNETCVYCHASRADMDATHTDMTEETARKMVDLALQTTSPGVTIEFQGGEPFVNFPVMKYVVDYAQKKNATIGKSLDFTVVSNLALMDDEKLAWLLENRVQICTSVDGPAHIHNKQRLLPGGDAFAETKKWIERINAAYADAGLDTSLYHVEALLTTTREALNYPKEIVDTYVELGCKALFLRPVDPFGFAAKTRGKIEYERQAYLDFYREALAYMLELNKQGIQILERYAAIFLTKIVRGEDPNFLDIRNPAGPVIGQIAYNYDGRIFTSDEGRMLHEMGDSFFEIGHLDASTYKDLMAHETVGALLLASNLDGNPDCVSCVYNPFCGISPEYNYRHQGSLGGRMRESPWCQALKGIQDHLFTLLAESDEATRSILERWTTVRPRDHFLHGVQTGSTVVE